MKYLTQLPTSYPSGSLLEQTHIRCRRDLAAFVSCDRESAPRFLILVFSPSGAARVIAFLTPLPIFLSLPSNP